MPIKGTIAACDAGDRSKRKKRLLNRAQQHTNLFFFQERKLFTLQAMTELQDKCRPTRVQAQAECDTREARQNSDQLCPQSQAQTQDTMLAFTLSLAKHKGDNAVSSLVKEYQWNNWCHDIKYQWSIQWAQFYPDWDSTFTAFEGSHTEDNAHKYYVVAWRRTKFMNTMTTVYYGNCPRCYQCLPITHCCRQCANQVSSKIYFQPPGTPGARPAIPHELAKAYDSLHGMRLIIEISSYPKTKHCRRTMPISLIKKYPNFYASPVIPSEMGNTWKDGWGTHSKFHRHPFWQQWTHWW